MAYFGSFQLRRERRISTSLEAIKIEPILLRKQQSKQMQLLWISQPKSLNARTRQDDQTEW